jgi:hypothetical protein
VSGVEVGKGNSGSALPMAPESSGYARRRAELRRAILPAWRHNLQENEGGNGEGVEGYL